MNVVPAHSHNLEKKVIKAPVVLMAHLVLRVNLD